MRSLLGRSGVGEGKVDRSVLSYSGNQMTHGLRLEFKLFGMGLLYAVLGGGKYTFRAGMMCQNPLIVNEKVLAIGFF